MTTTPEHTPLHAATWRRSASGLAVRAAWRGLHLSVWRRPQGGPYHFTISGAFPASVETTTAAIAYLWRRVLSRLGVGVSV